MGLGEISPHVQWYTGKSESGWNLHGAEPGELKVMFAAGLAYRKLWPMSVCSGPLEITDHAHALSRHHSTGHHHQAEGP